MHITSATAVALLATVGQAAVLRRHEDFNYYGRRSQPALKTAPPIELSKASAYHVREFEHGGHLSRRALSDNSDDTNLATQESWYWGNSDNPNANLTGIAKSDNERFLSMERFADSLRSTSCTANQVKFTFANKPAFTTAQNHWDWINQDASRYVTLVTEENSCVASSAKPPSNAISGTNTTGTRQPHRVTSARFNANDLTATFTGQPQTWEEALENDWHLRVSTEGILSPHQIGQQTGNGTNLQRRAESTGSINVAHDFSSTLAEREVAGVTAALKCEPCNTRGSLNFDVDVSGKFALPPIEGSFSITPSGLGAAVSLALTASGTLSEELSASIQLADIPLPGGISILGVVEIGPQLVIDASASISEISAEATLSFGVDVAIPDDSVAFVQVDDSSKNSFTNWSPQFTQIGPEVSASVSVTGNAGPRVSVQLAATILGTGAAAGVVLAAPELDMSLSAQASTEGVCGGSDPLGIEFDVNLGARVFGFGGIGQISDVQNDNSFDIFSVGTQLFSTCLGFGGGDAATSSAAPPTAPSAAPSAGPASSVPAVPSAAPVSSAPAAPSAAPAASSQASAVLSAAPISSAAPQPSSSAPAPISSAPSQASGFASSFVAVSSSAAPAAASSNSGVVSAVY